MISLPLTIIMFAAIPPRHRVLWLDFCRLGWVTLLSVIRVDELPETDENSNALQPILFTSAWNSVNYSNISCTVSRLHGRDIDQTQRDSFSTFTATTSISTNRQRCCSHTISQKKTADDKYKKCRHRNKYYTQNAMI